MVLPWCYPKHYRGITLVLPWCYPGITLALHGVTYPGVILALPWCYPGITLAIHGVIPLAQLCTVVHTEAWATSHNGRKDEAWAISHNGKNEACAISHTGNK